MHCSKYSTQFLLLLITSASLWSLGLNSLERDQEILDWVAPLEVQKRFPYFLSGYDEDGNPVWVLEFGKWDIRTAVEESAGTREDFTNYTKQILERFSSPHLDGKYDNATAWTLIGDLEGYNNRQLSSPLAVQQFLITARQYVEVLGKYKNNKKCILVNANILFNTLWSLGKPYMGQFADYTQVYGTNSAKWKPILRQHYPQSALPEWLGGSKGHKVVKVFG